MLASKLRPAIAPGHQIARPRLHALLEESVEAPVTLVVAPAGSGKTTLLAGWASQTRLPHAWVALDETDMDPVRLWSVVLAGLDQLAPGCAAAAAASLPRPGRLWEALGLLLDDLEARELSTRVLVVDDLHLVGDAEAEASIAFFVQHLPGWLHLVLISRREPALPVDRLRARGQLGEIRFAELRFTFEEASSMLGKLAPSLDADVVTAVATEAGGWAASIQFAALAARSARARGQDAVPHVDESLQYLDGYVMHEILGSESEELVDVLMATSVAERIEPGLARILAGRSDAPDLLATAQERGLFVSRAGPSGAFEVHDLVRERLVSVLEKRSPERLRELCTLAAGWYQEHGRTMLALDAWLRAERPRDALALLAAEAYSLYDGGQEQRIARVLAAIPESVADEGPDAALEFAWCHLLVDRRRFVALVDGLTRRVPRDAATDAVMIARLEILFSIAATLRGDWTAGAGHARSALRAEHYIWWLDPVGRFAWNMIGRDVAFSERWEEPSDTTREILTAIAVAPDRRLAMEGSRALGEALAGRPVDALRVAAGISEKLEIASMTILRAEVCAAQAIAHREVGDLKTALPLLQELIDQPFQPTVHCQLLAWLELVHARLSEGNLDGADDAFGSAVEIVDTDMSGPGARSWLARDGVVLALARGDVAEATAWAARVKDPFWARVGSARVLLASDEPGRAHEVLRGAPVRCDRHRVVAGLLMFRATGDRADAEQHLVGAVTLAARHGLVQTVAAEGSAVLAGVERLAWNAPAGWLRRLRRAATVEGDLRTAASELVAPLTARELEVLRMLPSRLTLRELADELYISPNTLKFHLKVIYRKLGCASRAEAAEVARALSSLRGPGQASSTRRR